MSRISHERLYPTPEAPEKTGSDERLPQERRLLLLVDYDKSNISNFPSWPSRDFVFVIMMAQPLMGRHSTLYVGHVEMAWNMCLPFFLSPIEKEREFAVDYQLLSNASPSIG